MAVLIGLISNNGVLIAGTGQSEAEAITSLENVIDTDITHTYKQALEDIIIPNGGDATPQREVGGGQIDTPESGRDDTASRETSQPSPEAPSPAGTSGDDEGALDDSAMGGGDPRAREETNFLDATEEEEGGPSCAVCNVGISADRAEVSVEDVGEHRCKQHM